jgi:hypothetical protein
MFKFSFVPYIIAAINRIRSSVFKRQITAGKVNTPALKCLIVNKATS